MTKRGYCAFAMSILAFPSVTMAAPPSQLMGKSVVVNWSETRSQRHVGETEWRSVNATHSLSVYISTAGRAFTRQVNSTRSGSGTLDRVAGEGNVHTSFDGQSMTVIRENRGGARRIVVRFDGGFAGCTASAGTGFESGKSSISMSPITKKLVEIRSVSVGGVSCSVQAGNVLGGGS
ncbi:hypothetical protein [Bradyrhizobium sp.]|uniref:hypothetical protein n=1 Tax=Bradyrhizobium sp. TaxID=376 RepID=UPI001DD40E59|nr:hypothetical protein [Bradyrhizobium sp.]MBI5320493.1 hypothetical protein [Bradyrhizobium sp.]